MSYGQGGPQWGSGGSGQQPGQGGGGQPYGQQNPQQQGGYGYPQQGQQQGGYGYPQQNSGAQQGGYGYPQAQQPGQGGQGGQYGQQHGQGGQRPGGEQAGGSAPDWDALANASQDRARKRRWLMAGGAALATVLVGVIVAVAVVSAGGNEADDKPSGLPATADIPSDSSKPGPTFEKTTPPPLPKPEEILADSKRDKAPVSAGSLFPGTKLTMGSNVYVKGPLNDTKKCADGTRGPLGKVLKSNGCTKLMRAAYTRGGVSVTVGVALFDTKAKAAKALKEIPDDGNIVSLTGGKVGTYCRLGNCRTTANAYGRYLYMTVSGYKNGKDATAKSKDVFAISDELREFTFRQINRRGAAQASAAAGEPS